MLFQWDPEKAEANEAKHSVSFALAASVFLDPLALTFPDADHSVGEMRFITLGQSQDGRILVVAHMEPDEQTIRIISARPATSKERRDYEEA